MMPFNVLAEPTAEIERLRRAEKSAASKATLAQFLAARMVLLYGLAADVKIDYSLPVGRWRHVDQKASVVRHGRECALPPRAILENPNNWPFFVAPDIAERLIERDGCGQHKLGKPI